MASAPEIPQVVSAGNVDCHEEKGRKVSRKLLINKLNYVNFQDETVVITLKHKIYNKVISLPAKPQPCFEDQLDCLWSLTEEIKPILTSFSVQDFFLNDGHKLIQVKGEVASIDEEKVSFLLPEVCYEVSARKVKRHLCSGINVQFIQNGMIFHGTLIDFSAVSFKVQLQVLPPQTSNWITPQSPVNIIFSNDTETLYSGSCLIIKSSSHRPHSYILQPLEYQIQRFKPKEYRSKRQKLTPSPDAFFKHPLTGKTINLKVIDISGCGFSVEEDKYNVMLLPGMIIPELDLVFSNSFSFTCRGQVIYSTANLDGTDGAHVKCGFAILDMEIRDHVIYLALLNQGTDIFSYIGNRVDMDALWLFFFETGFIYPKKYKYMNANKSKYKAIYEKVYNQNPHVARHFIYQDKGVIFAHIAMLRFYESSWMIQHHAAQKLATNKAGISVLKQISHSANNSHNLYSARMNYVFCYFRPENKFPNRVFGGFARHLKKPEACSLDTFAYLHYQKEDNPVQNLPDGWKLEKSNYSDLRELKSFYESDSGGLMTAALDLEPAMADSCVIADIYKELGLIREKHLYSLKKEGVLKAVVIVNIADVGLNMSDLTSSIKVIVLDADKLQRELFNSMLMLLSGSFEHSEIPVLIYPVSYAQRHAIPYEKLYTLWILNLQYLDPYFKFCETLLRRI